MQHVRHRNLQHACINTHNEAFQLAMHHCCATNCKEIWPLVATKSTLTNSYLWTSGRYERATIELWCSLALARSGIFITLKIAPYLHLTILINSRNLKMEDLHHLPFFTSLF